MPLLGHSPARRGSILLMLPDLPQVEEVLAGPDGILASEPDDLLLIIASSSSPVGVRELGMRLAQTTADAVRVVDAPVSGGVDGAEAGTLSIMVGGEERDVADGVAGALRVRQPGSSRSPGFGPGGEGVQPDDRRVDHPGARGGRRTRRTERSRSDRTVPPARGWIRREPHPGKPRRPDHSARTTVPRA